MKQRYLLLIFIYSFNTIHAQDEQLSGDWYLYHISTDTNITYNAVVGDYQPILTFSTNTNVNGLEFDGFVCNYQSGTYEIDITNNLVTINDMSITLGSCDEININNENLEDLYFFQVFNDDNPNSTHPTFSYTISGPSNSETLVLTNTYNSNYAVYERVAQSPDVLGQWYLYSLEIDSNPISNPSIINPTINFTTSPSAIGFNFYGSAICTGYAGNYYFNPQQTFTREDGLTTTLGGPCDTIEEDNFENLYFYSFLQPKLLDEFDYSITGNGDDAELVITNLSNGNKGFYGRQPLSVDENTFSTLTLILSENPVVDALQISNSQDLIGFNYEIYSITGKRILNGQLNSDFIGIEILHSGLYILKVSTADNQFETVKFIKY